MEAIMVNVRTLKRIAVAVVLIVAFGVVGTMDYEDAVAQEQHCKDMVATGKWPAEVCR
jgi:hypothetical protein